MFPSNSSVNKRQRDNMIINNTIEEPLEKNEKFNKDVPKLTLN